MSGSNVKQQGNRSSSKGSRAGGLATAVTVQPEIIAAVFWRRRRTIILTLILALLAAGAYLTFAKPVYTSTAKLVIDSQRAAQSDSLLGGPTRGDTIQDTKAKLLVATPVLTKAYLSLPTRTKLAVTKEKDPIAWMRQKLKIETSRRDDFIIVNLTLPDPEAAADIVNAVVASFLTIDREMAQSGPEKMVKVLTEQLKVEEKALEDSRVELISYGNAHPNLSSGASGYNNVIVQKLDVLQKQAGETDLVLGRARSELAQFKRQVATPEGIIRFVDTQQLKGAEFFDKEYLQVQTDIAQLQLARAVNGDEGTNNNPNARRISEAVSKLQDRADSKRRAMVAAWQEHLEQQVDSNAERLASLQRDIAAQRLVATELEADQVGLARRQAAVDRSQKAADRLASQIKDTTALEAGSALNVHVVEEARKETEPSGPNTPQTLAVGCLVGLVLGCGFAMIQESTDRRFREPNQVSAALGLPIVGLIPQMTRAAIRALSKPGGRGAAALLTSDAAEAYRSLYAMLAHGKATADAKALLVTSAMPGDGKSSCASNLAIAYAEAGRRTLLIDCDLRRPTQHTLFSETSAPGGKVRGVTDVIAGTAKLTDVVGATVIPNLGLLPCGTIPTNPHELLNSERLDAIIKFARKSFDMVIIDSPPIVNVPDARVLAPKADGVVLVVRTNRTTDRQSLFARNELLGVGAKVAGVVLNAVPRKTSEFAYYGSYKAQEGTTQISSRPKTALDTNGSFWPNSPAPTLERTKATETV